MVSELGLVSSDEPKFERLHDSLHSCESLTGKNIPHDNKMLRIHQELLSNPIKIIF